ncbi:SRPBCC family protein [uncultured Fibrella sp.]|uniref:SRPBCC family protein n=1 Tax=uncultured Fibrella sp. TaxID=1284596 RepID=UPI0035C9A43C
MQHTLIIGLSIWALTAPVDAPAQQSNTHFSHSVETAARPERIWQIWTDVPNWKKWDKGLKAAELNGPFATGTTGKLTPDKGPSSRFDLVEVAPGQSYTFRTKLPLGSLYVRRVLSQQNNRTVFTHEVWFKGLTKGIFGKVLGKNYRQILPEVMANIKTIAEQ